MGYVLVLLLVYQSHLFRKWFCILFKLENSIFGSVTIPVSCFSCYPSSEHFYICLLEHTLKNKVSIFLSLLSHYAKNKNTETQWKKDRCHNSVSTIILMSVKVSKIGARDLAQQPKCLPGKHEVMNWILGTKKKKKEKLVKSYKKAVWQYVLRIFTAAVQP